MEKDQQLEDYAKHFLLQWEHFPYPALMIRKDRTILAANPAAERAGVNASIRCCEVGGRESHRECLTACGLTENATKRMVGYSKDFGAFLDSYWMPVVGLKDVYIHFSIDIGNVADPALFPPEEEQ